MQCNLKTLEIRLQVSDHVTNTISIFNGCEIIKILLPPGYDRDPSVRFVRTEATPSMVFEYHQITPATRGGEAGRVRILLTKSLFAP